jgi:hypothetical protein
MVILMSVKEAKKKLEEANRLAEVAKKELAEAEKAVKAEEISELFNKISRALFTYHRFDFEDAEVGKLREALNVLRGRFSNKAFGSGVYLKKLNKLDAFRWPLTVEEGGSYTTESCIADNYARLTTDKDVAYDVATWMFDKIGSHPSRWDDVAEDDEIAARVDKVFPSMKEALGDDLALLSLETWTAGNHDT